MNDSTRGEATSLARCSICKAKLERDRAHAWSIATQQVACIRCEGQLGAKLSSSSGRAKAASEAGR